MVSSAMVVGGLKCFSKALARYAQSEGSNEALVAAMGLNVLLGAMYQDNQARCAAQLDEVLTELRAQGARVESVDRKMDVLLGGELRTAIQGLREVGQIAPSHLPRHLNRLADQFSLAVMRTIDLHRVHERRTAENWEGFCRFHEEQKRKRKGITGFFRDVVSEPESYQDRYPEEGVVGARLQSQLQQAAFGAAAVHSLLGNPVAYQYGLLALVPIEWEVANGGAILDGELEEINEKEESDNELYRNIYENPDIYGELIATLNEDRRKAEERRRQIQQSRTAWESDKLALLTDESARLREALLSLLQNSGGLSEIVAEYERMGNEQGSWADIQESFLAHLSTIVPTNNHEPLVGETSATPGAPGAPLNSKLETLKNLSEQGLIDTATYQARVAALLAEHGL